MKRDMDLCRKILFAIEEQYVDVALYDLKIDGHSMEEVAYHCKILHDAGLIFDYKGQYAGNHIYSFGVGALTWEGHDFLDEIRKDNDWGNILKIIKEKGLPPILYVVKLIATKYIDAKISGLNIP